MLEELRAEYRTQTIGPLITKRVRDLVEGMLRGRDPVIYARGAQDYRDGLEDVLHDFTIDVLLREGQLAYAFDNASDVDGFDRLVNRQLRRYLARTRERSIVDNLIDRAVRLMLADELVKVTDEGNRQTFSFATGPHVPSSDPGDSAIRRATAVAASSVPKIYSNPEERNPKVYTDEGLRTLLRVFLSDYRLPIRRQELQQIFELLLTPWTRSVLGLEEAVGKEKQELTPEEQVVVETVAMRITGSWTEREIVIFQYKHANQKDTDLARRLGVSRPTAAKAKAELFAALARDLADVDQHTRPAVIKKIADLTSGGTS